MAISDLRPDFGGGGGPVVPPGAVTGSAFKVEEKLLSLLDIANGYVTLAKLPFSAGTVKLAVLNGLGEYDYGVDYQMSGATKTLTWAGLGLDGLLEAGDTVKVTYFTEEL